MKILGIRLLLLMAGEGKTTPPRHPSSSLLVNVSPAFRLTVCMIPPPLLVCSLAVPALHENLNFTAVAQLLEMGCVTFLSLALNISLYSFFTSMMHAILTAVSCSRRCMMTLNVAGRKAFVRSTSLGSRADFRPHGPDSWSSGPPLLR